MKMFLDEFKVLDMSELLAVNGGYGSNSLYGSSSGSSYSSKSGYIGNSSAYPASSSYDALTSGLRTSDEGVPKAGNEADAIDRTKSSAVVEGLSSIGYRLLSEENTKGYTAGSERKYYQELFDDLKNNPNCEISTREISVEGSPSAGFGHEDVTEHMISSGDTIQLRVIDVNNDGKVDYVYKY